MDECDTYLGARSGKEHEELRGLVNAGHRRGAVAYRVVGEGGRMEVKEFPAFCAVALAGIGDVPATVLDRSVLIPMKRRAPNEHVEAFRYRKVQPQAEALRTLLEVWGDTHTEAIADIDPVLPLGLTDRAPDCWEPLVAIADYVGGAWPERARLAAVALHEERNERDPSLGVRLLADLRGVFGEAEHMFTDDILTRLRNMDESPWDDLYGKPLDSRGLARRLRKYGVKPKSVRIGERSAKGYDRSDLHDPWTRYLPSPPGDVTRVTSVTPQVSGGADVTAVTDTPDEDDWEARYPEQFEVGP
jgi:hypothetical protein